MNRHRAHARRSREEIIGQLTASDDAIRVVRQTPDGRVIAVRGTHHLGRTCEQLLAGRRDRIDDQNAVHQCRSRVKKPAKAARAGSFPEGGVSECCNAAEFVVLSNCVFRCIISLKEVQVNARLITRRLISNAGGSVSQAAPADKSDSGPIKVLVIDDSNTIRRSAELFLRQAGYEVILAEDGFDALSKISDHQPRVIFVDIMMPRLDGYQTCALIKQNPKLKSTPVIMLSSKDGVFDRARGRLAGSDRYLTKPFTKEGLIAAVNEYVKPSSVAS